MTILGVAATTISSCIAASANVLDDETQSSIDASALLVALGATSEGVCHFLTSTTLVLDVLVQAASWVGTAEEWAMVVALAALLFAAGWATMRVAESAVGPEHPFRRLLVGSAAIAVTGFLLHFVLPASVRMRAVSFAIFLGLAFVVVGTSLVRLFLGRSHAPDSRALSSLASAELGLVALGYIVLGLMRLSDGPVEARLVVGMVVWITMVSVAAAFVARFSGGVRRQAAGTDPAMSTIGHDPTTRMLLRQSGWFSERCWV